MVKTYRSKIARFIERGYSIADMMCVSSKRPRRFLRELGTLSAKQVAREFKAPRSAIKVVQVRRKGERCVVIFSPKGR